MDSGPASRTRSSVKRSLSRLPDELLQIILEYASSGGFRLRLVCRRFDAILSSLLLSSITISSLILPQYNLCGFIHFRRKSFHLPQMDAPLCPIDSHIQHVTIKMSDNYGYISSRKRRVHEGLPARMVKHLPRLKTVKLIRHLSDTFRFIDCSNEEAQAVMNELIVALKHIPAIHTEVELVAVATKLDASSVSSEPADWRYENIKWPTNLDDVWNMVDSLDVGARIADGLDDELARESISNPHIFHLHDHMVPGKFLSTQFPQQGFPAHLKRLHLRNPLIVNCMEILRMLRNCQHLKDLSLFILFNMESYEHGLPPGLQTLELSESGGTILPTFYSGLARFRYTFVGEPRAGDLSTVRNFIEHTPISHLELNAISFDDLKVIPEYDFLASRSGQRLLDTVFFYYFGHCCRISKSAAPSLMEILDWVPCGAPDLK